jgi:hypothetical protein
MRFFCILILFFSACVQRPPFWSLNVRHSVCNVKLPLNNNHLSTTATYFGFQRWSLYTGLNLHWFIVNNEIYLFFIRKCRFLSYLYYKYLRSHLFESDSQLSYGLTNKTKLNWIEPFFGSRFPRNDETPSWEVSPSPGTPRTRIPRPEKRVCKEQDRENLVREDWALENQTQKEGKVSPKRPSSVKSNRKILSTERQNSVMENPGLRTQKL